MKLEGVTFQYVVNLFVEVVAEEFAVTCLDETLSDLNSITSSLYATSDMLLDDLESSEAVDARLIKTLRLKSLREQQETITKKIAELENEQ